MICYSFFAFFVAIHVARSEEVSCPDQATSCSCPVGQSVCEFTLEIARVFTVSSYQYGPDGNIITTAGVPYTLDSTAGFVPSMSGVNRTCLLNGPLLQDEDFIEQGCSPPITVDGDSSRTLITINGRMPGPTLVVDQDATIRVTIVNNLDVDTSMHWHGMYQRNTPWMDGVGGITQASIPPSTSFDYIFLASPVGTHWYHSHVGMQRIEGMFGALVVRGDSSSSELVPEEDGNADIVDEPEKYTLTLFDWQELSPPEEASLASLFGFSRDSPAVQIVNGGMEPVERGERIDGSDVGPIPFHSGLINGRGRMSADTVTPLSVFRVMPDKYYRFRLVGVMSRHAFRFSIDGHSLRVISSDGKDVYPKDVEFVSLETGERYDVLVRTNATVGNYWIRAVSERLNVSREYSARAILSYEGADILDQRNSYSNVPERPQICTTEDRCKVLNCPFKDYPPIYNRTCVSLMELRRRPAKPAEESAEYPPDPQCSECFYFLNFGFDAATGVPKPTNPPHSINGTNFKFPPKPYQTNCGQYDMDNMEGTGIETCQKTCIPRNPLSPGCHCVNVIPMATDNVYETDKASGNLESIFMVFSELSQATSHPIHMHGHAFQVVYVGYGTYNEDGTIEAATEDIVCDDGLICTNPRWKDGNPPQGFLDRIVAGLVTGDAIQKDTVVVPAGGYVVIAIRADNPGYWFFHCHIEGHTSDGMVAVLQEYTSDQHRLPPAGIDDTAGFSWTVEEYTDHINAGETCGTTSDSGSEFKVSVVGFGVTLAILILLAIMCVILAAVLIVVYIKAAKNNAKSPPKRFQ